MKIHINRITTLTSTSDKSLLDVMESQGLQAEYHCRSGHCGACRCTLVSGEVEYDSFPLAFLNPGEILPCACKAKTDVVLENVHFEMIKKQA